MSRGLGDVYKRQVTPQIVGFLADRIGMTAAILVLAFNAVGMLVMAAVNVGMKKRG